MSENQTLYFPCPACGERFAQVEETGEDIHAGEIYHCAGCGGRVVFRALSFEEHVLGQPVRGANVNPNNP